MAAIGFAARRAGHGLRQFVGTTLLTSLTMALTLAVFGGFMLLQVNLEKLMKSWGDGLQLTAYLAQNVGAAELDALQIRLQSFPEIERIRHTSQEQAWRDFRSSLGPQSALLDGLPRDVLPASLEITVRANFRDSAAMDQLAQRLKQQKEFTQVDYPQHWAERLSLVVLALQWAKWVAACVLLLATFFIVSNMVKLAIQSRREEIEVMQLVGATETLVQAQLALEGLIQGLLGGAGAVALLWGVYRLLRDDPAGLSELIPAVSRIEFLDDTSIALILFAGMWLGASASVFALRGMTRSWKVYRFVG